MSVTSRCKNARAARGYKERSVATVLFDEGVFLAETGSLDTLVAAGNVMVAVGMMVVVPFDPRPAHGIS